MMRHFAILSVLVLLSDCTTAAPAVSRFTGVPLPVFTYGDQVKSAQLIKERCGDPPHCPADAYLESAVLAYVKLRAEVKAATAP